MPCLDNNDKSLHEIKKYELLVPSKMLKKAQDKFKTNKNVEEQHPKSMVMIDFKSKAQTYKPGDRNQDQGRIELNEDEED